MSDDGLDTKVLDTFIRMFQDAKSKIQIGVLQGSCRSNSSATNAEIGMYHEFGTTKMPARSWLRQPLAEHFNEKIESSQLFTEDMVKEVVRTNTMEPWLKIIAITAEGVVAEGFATGGYGKWAPWAPGYHNNAGQILVDTGQLRNSVTSVIKE